MSDEQKDFVAPNDISIIEAYLAISGNGHAFPFGIFDGELPVGFVMISYDVDDSYDDPPQIAYGNYSIWRLMIDERYQNKGYGRKALQLALDFVRTFPCGRAEALAAPSPCTLYPSWQSRIASSKSEAVISRIPFSVRKAPGSS